MALQPAVLVRTASAMMFLCCDAAPNGGAQRCVRWLGPDARISLDKCGTFIPMHFIWRVVKSQQELGTTNECAKRAMNCQK